METQTRLSRHNKFISAVNERERERERGGRFSYNQI